MKNEAFCRWYEKPLRDVTEVQQEQCEENGQQCDGCPDLILRENVQILRSDNSNRNRGEFDISSTRRGGNNEMHLRAGGRVSERKAEKRESIEKRLRPVRTGCSTGETCR